MQKCVKKVRFSKVDFFAFKKSDHTFSKCAIAQPCLLIRVGKLHIHTIHIFAHFKSAIVRSHLLSHFSKMRSHFLSLFSKVQQKE